MIGSMTGGDDIATDDVRALALTALITLLLTVFQDESGGSLSTGSGLDLEEGEEEGEGALGGDLRDEQHLQPGSDDDF